MSRQILIKIGDKAVPLSELQEDRSWGANPSWVGQQALKRYEETGETGFEAEEDGYGR